MKIMLVAPPFSGHLHPIIAIAKKLKEDSDLDVCIVSTLYAKQRVELENIKFYSVLDGFDEQIDKIANPAQKVKSNPISLYFQLKENIKLLPKLKAEFSLIVEKVKPDLIISDFTIPVAGIVANEKNIKWFTTLPSPCVYESNGVPAYLGGLYPPKNKYERLKYSFLNKVIKCFKTMCFLIFKKELKAINFDKIYDENGNENIYSKDGVFALGMKELEFNIPSQTQFEYVGPILYSPINVNNQELLFNENKKYVLITMGTHLKFLKNDLINEIKKISQDFSDIEFHITLGDDKIEKFEAFNNIKVLNYVSYDKYLSNYDYVIHHGGTGIMYECIKRGIKNLVFPQDYDQFDNAARLDYAGISIIIKNYNELKENFRKLVNEEYNLSKLNIYKDLYIKYNAENTIYEKVLKIKDKK